MKEYKVTVDSSMKGDNSPDSIGKKINEMIGEGWTLEHVTSFATTNVSKFYCIFAREKP
jgi:hypothetical protein